MIDYTIQLNTLEFRSVVKELTAEVDEVIETGTFHGDGSTRIFADTGKYVFTIECNYNNFVISNQNLATYENVCVLHGLSLSKADLIKGLLNESFDLDVTYDSKYPKSFYMREISQNVVVDNALELLCNNDRKQLIFLDSAGGVGYLEYLWVMNLPNEYLMNKILMLDDINHIKHYRSVKDLIDKGFDVQISEDKRFAWCVMSGYERD
jgi:hypothetical protein